MNKIRKTYKFRIYPSKQIEKKLQFTLNNCRSLYNTQLEYEKQIYFLNKNYANKIDLNNLILDWKVINPNLKNIHSQVLQNVSDRLHKSFKNFFTRVKKGEKPGFPRFKSKYGSFTYPQSGFKLNNNKLKLSKAGEVKVKLHREIKGKIKTLTIKKTPTNKWFAYFSVEEEFVRKETTKSYIGIDVGLNSFYTDSNGNKIENPKYLRESEKRLNLFSRKLSKRLKNSKNKNKSRLKLAKLHEKISNQRLDFLHKQTRKLVNNYSNIAVEKLQIKNMVKNKHLSKSISDASWNKFLQILSYKVEETGGQIIVRGKLEYIFPPPNQPYILRSSLYAFNYDGTLVSGWPYNFHTGEDTLQTGPVVGDVTNNGNQEVVMGSVISIDENAHSLDYRTKLHIFDNNGGLLINWTTYLTTPREQFMGGVHYGGITDGTPTLVDLDEDGDLDIVVSINLYSLDGDYDNSEVYVFDLDTPYNEDNLEWPMFRYNLYNTGLYEDRI